VITLPAGAEDGLGPWLEARCVASHALEFTPVATLFGDWGAWCAKGGRPVGSVKAFSQRLGERGFRPARRKDGRGFAGLGLRTRRAPEGDGCDGCDAPARAPAPREISPVPPLPPVRVAASPPPPPAPGFAEPLRRAAAGWDPGGWAAHVRERVARHEGDGLSRREATRLAYRACVELWCAAHPLPPCPLERCAYCGDPVTVDRDPIPPRGEGGAVPLPRSPLEPAGHVRVHARCLERFAECRQAQARNFLAVCGLGEPPP
jgi:hypothetical protein